MTTRFHKMLEYVAFGGDSIKDVIRAAKRATQPGQRGAVFVVFNGIALCVTFEQSEDEILTDYDNALRGISAEYVRRANLAGCEYWPDTYERKRIAWEDLV